MTAAAKLGTGYLTLPVRGAVIMPFLATWVTISGPLLPEAGWPFLILIFAITGVPIVVAVIGVIIGILRYRRNHVRGDPAQLPAVPSLPLESRLTEIDSLLASGRIDDAEHAAMRSRILDLR